MSAHNPLTDFVSYDELPYASYPFADSHPSRLAGIASIFGLNPVGIENARVLELGCASGGNLTPMAFYFPNAHFVGVDYSSVQINEGIQTIQKLGLRNVELKHMSVTQINPDFGLFDYIICHGVYSWVPTEVQDAILRVCRENLTDNGLAYVSYNVYPGWKTHEIARDAMLFHTRNISNLAEKVPHGRGMIEYMQQTSAENSTFRQIMNHELNMIQNAEPYYIAHEFLEAHNSPNYFKDFNARVEAQGLTYLGDSQLPSMFVETLGAENKSRLLNVCEGEQVLLEQYIDFITNRTFRQTILVKAKLASSIERSLNNANLKKIAYQCLATRTESSELPPNAEKYEANNGNRNVMVYTPTQKATMSVLKNAWPNPMSYDELKNQVTDQNKAHFIERELLQLLEQLLIAGFISPWNNTFGTQYSIDKMPEQPKITPLVAQYAQCTNQLVSHLHQSLQSNLVMDILLPLLDGNHDTNALVDAVRHAAANNQINFESQSTKEIMTDPAELEKEIRVHVQNNIETLKNSGFIIQS